MDTDHEVLVLAGLRAALADGRAREARERARITQAEVGRAIHVSASAVNGWEGGRRRPRGEAAIRYAELLEALGLSGISRP